MTRELGVRYVLEGSIRRPGNQVRVSAELIDADTSVHLWAERFDHEADDLLALQNEITSRIAVALNLELIGAEAVRPAEHPDVLDYILRGRSASYKPPSRDKYAQSISLTERALALDPSSVAAQSHLAIYLTASVLDNMTDTASADIARAEELAAHALASSPRSPLALFAKGQVFRVQRRPEEALSKFEMVVALNRNWTNALGAISWCKLYIGSFQQVIPVLAQAIRRSPRDPFIGTWYDRIGTVHLLQSRIDEAIVWFEKAIAANPAHSLAHSDLASAYALKGAIERASAALAEARRLSGDDRFLSIARLKAARCWGVRTIRALFDTTYLAGLRKLGVPAE
jgi:tetratricopeptide (TPR) repeat protein